MPVNVTISRKDRTTGKPAVVEHSEANEVVVRDGHLYVNVMNSRTAAIYAPNNWESAEASFE